MIFWATLAGFNKGVGGGGYGPVVTIGGLLSGVPAKSMMAVTAISEGTVSTFSIIIWLLMLSGGVIIDYLLLPSMMIATILSAVVAPWAPRVFPERIWQVRGPGLQSDPGLLQHLQGLAGHQEGPGRRKITTQAYHKEEPPFSAC
jgi:hypothetical protein